MRTRTQADLSLSVRLVNTDEPIVTYAASWCSVHPLGDTCTWVRMLVGHRQLLVPAGSTQHVIHFVLKR